MPKNHDRLDLCHCTYADGRRCTLPQFPDDLGLCFHHGQKYRARLESKEAGRQISQYLDTDIPTACDLTSTLNTLFRSTALGYTKPKVAIALAYIAQLMMRTQKLAKQEFLQAFKEKWPDVVREGPAFNPPEPEPEVQPPAEPQASAPVSEPTPTPILVPDSPPSAEPDPAATDSDSSSPSDDDLISFPGKRIHL
jgi:hypothetical protein